MAPDVTALSKYADELDVIVRGLWPISPRDARQLDDLAHRMRRDATIKPNAKPFATYGRPPISGGREVFVVRERRSPRRRA
jgi:hypothetical protein